MRLFDPTRTPVLLRTVIALLLCAQAVLLANLLIATNRLHVDIRRADTMSSDPLGFGFDRSDPLDKMGAKLTDMESKLDSIASELSSLTSDVSNIDSYVESIYSDVSNIRSVVENIELEH